MNLLSSIGEDADFIAFNAHWGFAFFCMFLAYHWHLSLWVAALFGVVLAAVKEFYFDLKYETDPPQTWQDSALDFAGYLVGILLAAKLVW